MDKLLKPRKRLVTPCDSEGPATAILVHGTFAGAPEDTGQSWWQAASPISRQLQKSLPASVHVARESQVFHWSGENSERARNKAALDLLSLMKSYESAGANYHLVGHSHGGSVIWNALKLATLNRQNLTHLRSWTTVGTPFLQNRSHSAWNPLNVLGIVLGLALFRPAFLTVKQVALIVWNAAIGAKDGLVLPLPVAGDIADISVFKSPILSCLMACGIKVSATSEGVQIGSFNANGDQSLAAYMFTTGEGLFIFAFAVLAAYLFLNIGLFCIRPAVESYRIRAEQRLEQMSFENFGPRWLGIWSTDDEAINGLRATLDLSMSFVAKMYPRERVFFTDAFSLLSRPYFWVLAPIYNRFLHPSVDSALRSIVTRSAQGNDRPTANIVDVTPSPLSECLPLAPTLPAALNEKILVRADQYARDIAPKLRRLLGQPSFTSGLEAFGKELSGEELVHTSYFDHQEILELIASNIAWGTSSSSLSLVLRRLPQELVEWFIATKQALQLTTNEAVADPGNTVPQRQAA
jgi:hypothetical protein